MKLNNALINKSISWYVHTLCMNKDRIAKVLNMKITAKHPTG
jgi:hypothetical protein